ncbi:MAG: BspA family leucine-rich repeat surface protein, partial [Limosilactobacillus sp.]|uniref:Rib/alpha-like domain-containing protein n=1 Tax=Limosilactobacillus sp. TaxID=2773925 RepID=UPI0027028144|nr:BspA family leucine-rich repeat surface protein [Limosilactobacillus sp.]
MKAQPTYRLRKLTIGFCSVTLMAIFAGHATVAHADEQTANNTAVTETVADEQQTTQNTVLATDDATDASASSEQNTQSNDTATTESPDIDSLALSSDDKTTVTNTYNSADADQKTAIVNSINAIKNFGTITKNGTTYSIGDFKSDIQVTDVILPTVGDFTNLGLSCDQVTINSDGLKSVAANKTIRTISTSKTGGRLTVDDTSLDSVFMGLYQVTKIDLSALDTSKVTSYKSMFERDLSLVSLDVSSFDTTAATDMHDMFGSCEALTELDISNFNTANVTNMMGMFTLCQSLTNIKWNPATFVTSKVTNMSIMFSSCSRLESLDLSNFDTSSVENMQSMFANCTALSKLDLSSFNYSKVNNINSIFSFCRNLGFVDLKTIVSELPQGADILFMFTGSNNVIVRADKDQIDPKMDYYPGKPSYQVDGSITPVTVSVPTIVQDKIDNVSDYIKGYMDKAVADANYAYKDGAPTVYTLSMSPTVVPLYKDVGYSVYWVVPNTDGTFCVGDLADNFGLPKGLKYDGKEYVMQIDVLKQIFWPLSSDPTDYAVGPHVTPVKITDGYYWDGKSKFYRFSYFHVRTFNAMKEFVTTHLKTDPRDEEQSQYIADDGTVTVDRMGIKLQGKFDWATMKDLESVSVDNEGYVINGQVTNPADSLTYDKDKVKSVAWKSTDALASLDVNDSTNLTAVVTFTDGSSKEVEIPVYKAELASIFQNAIEDNMKPLYYTDNTPLTSVSDDLAKKVIGTPADVQFAGMTIKPEIKSYKYNDNGTITVTFGDDSNYDFRPEQTKVTASVDKDLVHNVSKDYGNLTFNVTPQTVGDVSGLDNSTVGTKTATVNVTMDNGQTLVVPFNYNVVGNDTDNASITVKSPFFYTEGKLPEASSLLTGLPTDATAKWTKTSSEDDPAGVITVTFKDNTTADYSTTGYIGKPGDVLTATEADLYDGATDKPFGIKDTFKFEEGKLPEASTLITATLPDGATATWKKAPTDEDPAGVITVTFADQSTIDLNTTGYVGKKIEALTATEADLYDGAEEKPFSVKDTFKFEEGKLPEASTLITGTLPDGASVAWTKTPTEAEPAGVITVTFADKSTADFNTTGINGEPGDVVTGTEADLYDGATNKPFSVKSNFKFEEGKLPEASSLITGTLPDGATATWKKAPTDEDPAGVITVTFADQSTIDLNTTGYVGKKIEALTATEADLYDGAEEKPFSVKSNFTFVNGQVPDASTLITGTLPDGATPTWTKTPTEADPAGVITVTFADKSTADFNTTGINGEPGDVVTGTEADLYDGATNKPFSVKDTFKFEEDKLPEASSLITGTLPDGATATWKKAPTDEDPDGVITVNFADQSTTDLTTTGYVGKKIEPLTRTESDMYELDAKGNVTATKGTELTAKDVIDAFTDFPADVKWTLDGYDKDKVGQQTITVTATFADGSTLKTTVNV